MSVVSTKKNIVSISTTNGEPVSLTINADDDAPATVQLVVESRCSCSGANRRAGAYTDTGFGTSR